MPPVDPDRFERERLEADRRYNDALTALDRTLVGAPDVPPAPHPSGSSGPELAALADVTSGFLPTEPWWRGGMRHIWRVFAPVFNRQQMFNARIAREMAESAARDGDTRRTLHEIVEIVRGRFAALEQFETTLILFLQQITAFVEARDRQLAAGAAARLDAHDQALEAVPDLRAQVGVLQRATQMLTRELEARSQQSAGGSQQSEAPSSRHPAPSAQHPAPDGSHQPLDDYKYVGFEDRFRGSDEDIRTKLRAYLPLFAGTSDVLDLGCGRGEFLALLQAEGVRAIGVDANHEMAAVARARGLDVVESDGLAHLDSVADGSLGGLMAAQVVEHLEPAYLMRLLATAFHRLRPGAPIVIETINPACWLAFFSSYLRDFTHVRPIHPETLQYLLQASGFGSVTIRYSAPVPDHMKMRPVDLPAETLAAADPASRALVDTARVANANAAILNNLLFSYLDYAAIGYRS